MRLLAKLIHSAFCIVVLSNVLLSADLAPLDSALQRQLEKIVKENDLPGITMAVAFDDKHVINLAAGFADKEKNKVMTPSHRMFSGSVGKVFVSALIMLSKEAGQIQLDDHISKYFSSEAWFNRLPNHDSITIKNLLNHTSGIPRYIFQPSFLAHFKDDFLLHRDPMTCISYILDQPPIHPVGKDWAYSDTNFLLLGLILEQVTGEKYVTLLKGFLERLHLNLTTPSLGRQFTSLSQGYVSASNPFGLPDKMLQNDTLVMNPAFEWTGGGVVTNVTDLVKFIKMLHEGQVLSETSLQELRAPVSMSTGEPSDQGYGLGSFVWSKSNDTRCGHAGFFPGYLSHVEYSSKKQYAIAIQINSDQGSERIAGYIHQIDQIIDEFLDDIDEANIKANFEKQENCWNKGDHICYMEAYLRSDSIQTISRAGVDYGYDNILKNYRTYFPVKRMGLLHFDALKFTRLSSDLYFATGRFNLAFPGGNENASGWFSVNLRKINGAWYMITDHSS